MTKNQKAKLASQVATFIVVFSLMMASIPYVVVILALYFAIQAARRI